MASPNQVGQEYRMYERNGLYLGSSYATSDKEGIRVLLGLFYAKPGRYITCDGIRIWTA